MDSLAVDAGGNIAVATIIDSSITVLSPAGEMVGVVDLPDRYATNVCFAGPDLKMTVGTLSHSGRMVGLDWNRPGLRPNFSER